MTAARMGAWLWGVWFLVVFLLTHQPLALIIASGFLALFVMLRHR